MGLRDKIFFRSLAIVYFLAFGSLYMQIKGLIGAGGILPVRDFLASVKQSLGANEYWYKLPTLFWLNSSDEFMRTICLIAILLSVVFFMRLRIWQQALIMFLLYAFYLSFVNVAQDFMSFQWDVLLLETGFLGFVYLAFYNYEFARKIITWMFWILIFRLMLMSGLVKLASGDPSWTNLSALSYHYQTQPLPNPLSFFVHQLPFWFHQLSCAVMFVIELLIPLCILMGRNARLIAGLSFLGLMLVVIATGNYCFFNLLTIALCLWLVDDDWLYNFVPSNNSGFQFFRNPTDILSFKIKERLARLGLVGETRLEQLRKIVFRLLILVFFVYYLASSTCFLVSRSPLPEQCRNQAAKLVSTLTQSLQGLHVINPYGLFAIMTTVRNEIVIQGANDVPGQLALSDWLDYEFYWKPGDIKSLPQQVAPYQPRLDWQMWFAALSNYQSQPWFVNLCVRILENKQDVLKLIKVNPYTDKAPKYIRAVVYEYKFNDLETYSRTGEVWKRELKGLYLPAISLRPQV